MMNQQKVFADRLARIAAHSGNTNATLHIGLDDQVQRAALVRAATLPQVRLVRGLPGLVLPMALISGAAGWAWAHWARVTVVETQDPMIALGADLVAALVVVLLLRLAFGFRGIATLLAQAIGAAAGFAGLHNAVHLWPEHFATVFPEAWMAHVLDTTQPMTLTLNALVF